MIHYIVSGDKVLITSNEDMIQYFEDNPGKTIDDKQKIIVAAYEGIENE
ncbi:MAG: hypothetical protein II038_09825 [Lachnospiraceae bacterium]|nr:hypothetical protein [Lachnospiraceae bacterium]